MDSHQLYVFDVCTARRVLWASKNSRMDVPTTKYTSFLALALTYSHPLYVFNVCTAGSVSHASFATKRVVYNQIMSHLTVF
jgi:hypothetical protein